MIKFIVFVECTDLIHARVEVGRALGKLIDTNKWKFLGNSRDTSMNSDVTQLGFPNLKAAEAGCDAIDDLGIVGLTTHIEGVVKGL